MELGLTYQTSAEKMQEAMGILRDMPNRVTEESDKDLVASFTKFTDSALVITFVYFIRKSADNYEVQSKANKEVLCSFNHAGLNFAFPSRTVYIEKE